jgi:hypothetical protein
VIDRCVITALLKSVIHTNLPARLQSYNLSLQLLHLLFLFMGFLFLFSSQLSTESFKLSSFILETGDKKNFVFAVNQIILSRWVKALMEKHLKLVILPAK